MLARALVAVALLGCGSDPMAEALRADPETAFRLWTFTAAAPEGPWTRGERPLAAGVSSLGLHAEGGRLAITALPMRPPAWWEELAPRLAVRGFLARPALDRAGAGDPGAWTPASWPIDDPGVVAAIDPQGFEGGFWYYAATGREGDPARAGGDHAIRSSHPPEARLTAPGLADPAPVRLRGELLLFATRSAESVVLAGGEPLRELARFPGVSVPFAVLPDERDALFLLAQAVVEGRRQPVLSVSQDGLAWSEWRPVLDLGPLRSCTSPVLGRLTDGYLLACVEEPGP